MATADGGGGSGSGSGSGAGGGPGVCPIILHIPTSSLQFGPDIVGSGGADDGNTAQVLLQTQPHLFEQHHQQQILLEQQLQEQLREQQHQPKRPHPGGLETLVEASHVNALADATGPSPQGLQSYAQRVRSSGGSGDGHNGAGADAASSSKIDAILASALAALSPPSRSRAITRTKGYTGIAVDLANERWRERWSRLCLAADEDGDMQQQQHDLDNLGLSGMDGFTTAHVTTTGGNPAAGAAGWEVYAQASGAGGLAVSPDGSAAGKLARSTSRKGLGSPERKSYLQQQQASPNKSGAEVSRAQAAATASSSSNSYGTAWTEMHVQADQWRTAPCFHPSEVNIARYEDSEGVTAVASSWLELDSPDEGIRLDSEIALRQELSYASHLGITTMILPPPSSDPECQPFLVDYARAVSGCFTSRGSEAPAAGHFMRLSIRLPLSSPYKAAQVTLKSGQPRPVGIAESSANAVQTRTDDDWSWQVWHVIESLCGNNARLSVALDLSAPLPSAGVLDRWIAEPVSHVWLPIRTFLANAKGFPVLSKANQAFLRSLVSVKAPSLSFILVGSQNPPRNHSRGGQAAYEQYIRHIERSVAAGLTAEDMQMRGYADYLQAPLQPLFDNLEGQTYATFEADAIKYDRYEEAVFQALRTLPRTASTLIWVCGAGRGPLVSRCIEAGRRAVRTVRIVALEKNANAIVGLRNRAVSEWGADVVTVEMGDMRTVNVPEQKADIVVSELLGSFGDNELSPECLDGAMRLLKPEGICIPQAYTSYVSPISTPKLWSEVRTGAPVSSGLESSLSPGDKATKAAETPYVVLLKAVTYIAGSGPRDDPTDVQSCWTFDHSGPAQAATASSGLPLSNTHNARIATLTFRIPRQSVCHGMAGFFEAHLFGDVVLSIHPDPARRTPGMMSWFPIYFPFKEPLYLAPDAEVDFTIWRLTSQDRVWYEWVAQSFVKSMPSKIGDTQGSINALDGQQGAPTQMAAPPTPTLDAFLNPLPNVGGGAGSPGTPRISFSSDGGASNAAIGAAGSDMGGSTSGSRPRRTLVGMSALMNPGGRSSCVRM